MVNYDQARERPLGRVSRNRQQLESARAVVYRVGRDGTVRRDNRALPDLPGLGESREEHDQPVIEDVLACLRRDEALDEHAVRIRREDHRFAVCLSPAPRTAGPPRSTASL